MTIERLFDFKREGEIFTSERVEMKGGGGGKKKKSLFFENS